MEIYEKSLRIIATTLFFGGLAGTFFIGEDSLFAVLASGAIAIAMPKGGNDE